MKQTFFLVLCIAIISSCKKDIAAGTRSQIAGQWEYVTFSGYPFNNNVEPPGNGKIIVFTTNGSFERRSHDTTLFRGNYQLDQRKDCSGNEKYVFLKTSDSAFVSDYSINVSDGKLYICTPNCYADGGCSVWRKL